MRSALERIRVRQTRVAMDTYCLLLCLTLSLLCVTAAMNAFVDVKHPEDDDNGCASELLEPITGCLSSSIVNSILIVITGFVVHVTDNPTSRCYGCKWVWGLFTIVHTTLLIMVPAWALAAKVHSLNGTAAAATELPQPSSPSSFSMQLFDENGSSSSSTTTQPPTQPETVVWTGFTQTLIPTGVTALATETTMLCDAGDLSGPRATVIVFLMVGGLTWGIITCAVIYLCVNRGEMGYDGLHGRHDRHSSAAGHVLSQQQRSTYSDEEEFMSDSMLPETTEQHDRIQLEALGPGPKPGDFSIKDSDDDDGDASEEEEEEEQQNPV